MISPIPRGTLSVCPRRTTVINYMNLKGIIVRPTPTVNDCLQSCLNLWGIIPSVGCPCRYCPTYTCTQTSTCQVTARGRGCWIICCFKMNFDLASCGTCGTIGFQLQISPCYSSPCWYWYCGKSKKTSTHIRSKAQVKVRPCFINFPSTAVIISIPIISTCSNTF